VRCVVCGRVLFRGSQSRFAPAARTRATRGVADCRRRWRDLSAIISAGDSGTRVPYLGRLGSISRRGCFDFN